MQRLLQSCVRIGWSGTRYDALALNDTMGDMGNEEAADIFVKRVGVSGGALMSRGDCAELADVVVTT